MIFYIVAIIIMAYAFTNFKKAFLLFILFKSILVTNITFISLPGLPLLTVDTFMTLFFISVFLTKRKVYAKNFMESFPLKKPFYVLSISWFISTIFAIVGFGNAFSMFIGNVSQLLVVWMMWNLIVDKKDVKFLIKGFTFLFCAYALYFFFEFSIQSNPLVEYESTLISKDRAIDFVYGITEERGYRGQSVFEHSIGAGINFAMYCMLALSLLYTYRLKLVPQKKLLITFALCGICVFLTNSRGPIVFFLIECLSFVQFKRKNIVALIFGLIFFIAVLDYLPSEFRDNLYSIFDSSYQDKVGGSNKEQRLDQLEAAWLVMMQSPLFGLGYKFMNVLDTPLTARLLGLESMWFQILTNFGMLGLCANIYAAYYFLLKLPKRYHSRPMFFLALAYWITASLTSVPGMLMYFYYMIYLIFIKLAANNLSDK